MNENETELKVQALVDGELAGAEADALRARIEGMTRCANCTPGSPPCAG